MLVKILTNVKLMTCAVLQKEFLVTIPLGRIIVYARNGFMRTLT